MIRVTLPRIGTTLPDEIEAVCNLIQATPELGFVFKAVLVDHIKSNERRGTIWSAYLDDQLAGVAIIGSRRPYPHCLRTGEVAVKKEFRRQRVGTSLYLATALTAVLEGRRIVEETVIEALSPWMLGPHCTIKPGVGFLPALNYRCEGRQVARTSGWKDIVPMVKDPISELDDYIIRTPEDTSIEVIDTPEMRANFDRCIENYRTHNPKLANRASHLRKRLPIEVEPVELTIISI